MGESYPVMLQLEGHICAVVGGGAVATRKVNGLLTAGARVTVITPTLCTELQTVADSGAINTKLLPYSSEVLIELRPMLVFAATDDPTVNAQIAADARVLGILVNRADEALGGDFLNMAIVRRGAITVAVSTGGASPALGKHISNKIAGCVGDEYGILAEWMAEKRHHLRNAIPNQQDRAGLWQSVIDSPILDRLREGRTDEARELFDSIVQTATEENT